MVVKEVYLFKKKKVFKAFGIRATVRNIAAFVTALRSILNESSFSSRMVAVMYEICRFVGRADPLRLIIICSIDAS